MTPGVALRRLVDYGQPELATWLEAQGFVDVQQDTAAPYSPYWSATTRDYQTNTAYGVRLDAATEWAFMKEPAFGGIGSVWAVSGGEPAVFADGFEAGNVYAWSASVW